MGTISLTLVLVLARLVQLSVPAVPVQVQIRGGAQCVFRGNLFRKTDKKTTKFGRVFRLEPVPSRPVMTLLTQRNSSQCKFGHYSKSTCWAKNRTECHWQGRSARAFSELNILLNFLNAGFATIKLTCGWFTWWKVVTRRTLTHSSWSIFHVAFTSQEYFLQTAQKKKYQLEFANFLYVHFIQSW